MAPAETGPLGVTTSIVVVAEVTTAFKFIVVAVARVRKPTKNFTADPKTYLPPLPLDSDTIDRPNNREAIVSFFVAWSESVWFPIVVVL
jgi:hypothetical protein